MNSYPHHRIQHFDFKMFIFYYMYLQAVLIVVSELTNVLN
eukprot:UN04445